MPSASRSNSEKICRRVLLIGDIAMVSAAFLAAAILSPTNDLLVDPIGAGGSLALPMITALAVLELALLHSGYSWVERIQQISLALGSVFLLEAFSSYVGFAWQLELQVTFFGSALCALLLIVWYVSFRLIFPKFPRERRVLLLGADVAFSEIAGAGGYQALGPVPFPDNIRGVVTEWNPDAVVVGEMNTTGAFPANALLDLRFHGVSILDAATFFETSLQRVSCRHLQPVRLLYGDITPKRQNLALQAVYSNALGLAALALAAPVMLVAAIALKISAPREPLLDSYRAVGLHGIPFDRLRFQSRSALGKMLARIRVRGLPQLFNVVRGEMSLVGPQASRVEFNDALCRQVPYYSQRVAVRPGLTGWAQIHRRQLAQHDASIELEYDLYYVKHLSPSFDVDILLATIFGGAA